MSVLDKFLNAMKLNDDEYDDYDDEDGFFDEDDDDFAEDSKKKFSKHETKMDVSEEEVKPKPIAKVTPMRQRKNVSSSSMEVCVIRPTNFDDAREITETLLSSRTVVLNLEGLDVDIAQRIIDFTSGSCYAIKGNLQKISHYIFIVTPQSVDISGDFQDLLSSGSFEVPSVGNRFK